MKRLLALLLACALLTGCGGGGAAPKELPSDCSEPLPPSVPLPRAEPLTVNPHDSETVNAALSAFGLELLRQTRAANGEAALASEIDHAPFSTLVSPLSVALALSMAANGAEGGTLAQFEEVLAGGAGLIELNSACAQFMYDYQGLKGSSQCSIANSLWLDPGGQIKDDFVGKCRGIYSAQVYEAELSASRIVGDLNRWVSDKTNKLIPKIIGQPFDGETACLLVSALYLKNTWQKEFDPLHTREMAFHHAGGPDGQAEYLQYFDTKLSYIKDEGAQGVVLPYDDGRLAFFALLPDLYPDSPGLGDWLDRLSGSDLSWLIDSREETQFLRFAMPKFQAEWSGRLEKILPALGLEDAFTSGAANFSSLGDNPEGYYLSQVIHAAKIEVNEQGTEAAAATVAAANSGGTPPQEGVTLILDRPFLYGILDLYTGVPLFLGTYE